MDILVQFGCNLQFRLTNGNIALHVAMLNGRENAAELLAESKIGVNAQNSSMHTPLHLAAQRSFHAGVRILLKAGALLDLRDTFGRTALYTATHRGDGVSMKLLLDHYADVSLKVKTGISALQAATNGGHLSIVRMLLDHGADVDDCDNSKEPRPALFIAVCDNSPDMVRLLLQRGANVNFQAKLKTGVQESALHFPVKHGLAHVVRSLLEFHPDLEARNFPMKETVLLAACRSSMIEIVKDLLTAGADMEAKTEENSATLVVRIFQAQNFPLAQILIDGGASLDYWCRRKGTLLHEAVTQDNMEAMEFLLRNKHDVNLQDVNGMTPLMLAADRDQAAAMRTLLGSGASVDAADRLGRSALHLSAAAGSNEAVKILLEHGTDPLAVAKRQETPLGIANHYGHEQVEQQLLEALEKADRVIYDSRWPNRPLYVSLEAIRYDYEVLGYYGQPRIRPLPHPSLFKPMNDSTTLLDRSFSPHPPKEASDSYGQPATFRSFRGPSSQPEIRDMR
jgi:ankyrin repeat protein